MSVSFFRSRYIFSGWVWLGLLFAIWLMPSYPGGQAEAAIPGHKAVTVAHNRQEIVFIDPAVSGYRQIIPGIPPDAEVVVLDAAGDGVAQITKTLAGRTGVDALHIISHGGSASLNLGSAVLNTNTLDNYATQFQIWSDVLSPGADLLLYGCEVAAGREGKGFVRRLAKLTDADVAASDNLTGNMDRGGDWVLEQSIGSMETHTLNFPHYAHLLANNLITNGDFSAGNSGFSSDYTFQAGDGVASTGINNMAEGKYSVVPFAKDVHSAWTPAFDHTTGDNTGKYFVGNGSALTSLAPWKTTTALTVTQANTAYRFEAYISTLFTVSNDVAAVGGTDGPILKFQIGDGTTWVDMGTTNTFIAGAAVGQWNLVFADGKFNQAGNYLIRLVNNQTAAGGNDFGLDDIYFGLRTSAPSVGSNPGVTNPPTFPTNGINSAPSAINDTVTTTTNTIVTTSNVLANDSDVNGDTLSVSAFDAASVQGGTVTNNGNGTFTYTPPVNFIGADSFTYTVSDGNSGTDIGTVNITVNAPPSSPPPPILAAVGVNGLFFSSGNPLILSGVVTPGSRTGTLVDAYITITLPTGQTFYLQPDGTWSLTMAPVVTDWPLASVSGTILDYVFQGTEPPGVYISKIFFTLPGTMTPVGREARRFFIFTPQ